MHKLGNLAGVAAAPAPANAMQQIQGSLSGLAEQASMLNDRLGRVLSRAFGDPTGGEVGGQPKAVPAGQIGAITEQLTDLNSILGSISAQIDRIDTIV